MQPKKWDLGVSGHTIRLETKALTVGTMFSLTLYNVNCTENTMYHQCNKIFLPVSLGAGEKGREKEKGGLRGG